MPVNSAQWAAIRQELLKDQEYLCQWCHAPDGGTVYRVDPLADMPATYIIPDTREIRDARTGKVLSVYPGDKKLPPGAYKRVVLDMAFLDHDETNDGQPGKRPNVACLCQACQTVHSSDLRARIAADAERRKQEAKARKREAKVRERECKRQRKLEEDARQREAQKLAQFGPLLPF